MKKIVVSNYKEFGDQPDKKTLVIMGGEDMDAQDGYHTFTELYDHRIALFIALCREIRNNPAYQTGAKSVVWKSKLHSDGSSYDGWFILGIGSATGEQISYHLPMNKWDETDFADEREVAWPWDGHTPDDVLKRLKDL